MKRIIKYLILGVIAVVFVGTLVFLYQKSQQPPVVFQLDSPARMTIVKKTVATGKVIPRREIEVKAQVSGVVEKLYVVAGQTVKKGAIIARISLRPNMLNVSAAEAQLLQARINLQNQATDMQRYQKLLRRPDHLRIAVPAVRDQLQPAEGSGGVGGEHPGAAEDRCEQGHGVQHDSGHHRRHGAGRA